MNVSVRETHDPRMSSAGSNAVVADVKSPLERLLGDAANRPGIFGSSTA